MENYSWIKIYNKIAHKILEYKNKPQQLVKIMYKMLEEAGLMHSENEGANLDSDGKKRIRYDNIDPISFMNRFDMYSKANRIKLIELFQKNTGMEIEIPNDFDGIPSTDRRRSLVIRFKDQRDDEDIPNIWKLFEVALTGDIRNEKERNKFIEYYDKVISKPIAKFNISVGLFKIRPDTFINLDRINRNYINKKFNIKINNAPTGKEYLELIHTIKSELETNNETLLDFSYNAWKNKEEKNYWMYQPGENARMWNECMEKGVMLLGYDEIGDLRDFKDSNDLLLKLKEVYNKENPVNDKCALEDFKTIVQPGDIIFVKKGLYKLIGYGEVTSDYYYDKERKTYRHVRNVNWIKTGEWNVSDIEDRKQVAIKTLTRITQSDNFVKKALKMMGKDNDDIGQGDNAEWIIPANNKYYNHKASFQKNGFIDWSQNVNYNIGDIVYLYSVSPERKITAKTIVEKVNLTAEEKTDDSEFMIGSYLNKRKEKYARLRLIENVDDERLDYDELVKHGLKGYLQSAKHIPPELSRYINNILNGLSYDEDEIINSVNEIYYGGPGCGKSKIVEDKYCKDDNYIRTTFYPDYTNSDFIGQLVPFYNKKEKKLEYRIKPGYFTRAYEKALKNKNKNIYLIIEEINRGNAAAIFGDVFQLLDRVTDNNISEKNKKKIGESEYEISNNIIEEYILDSCDINLDGKIKIPENLSIIATINTSDQNVYTLDSAFKRRWKMVHVSNSFENISYDSEIGSRYVPMLNCDITWKDFVNRINKAIVDINTFGINYEDKQIGKYFVQITDLLEAKVEEYDNIDEISKSFAEKVLMYLWEDVAKLEPTEWFNENIKTLDTLLKQYQEKGIKVFSENIQRVLKPDEDGNEYE